ncbi:MAG: hypothetical protein J6O49_04100 [Bacteroidaceae bacterium]|jgi:hypothetical protein|nr:hypothetical protein [Bacteroidaceae bacterium]
MDLTINFLKDFTQGMSEYQKNTVMDEFESIVSKFSNCMVTGGVEYSIRNALRPFLEKYNLTNEDIEFVWQ